MKIKFLGTAAAEGIPAMFCECDTCKRSKESVKENIRTRSQAIVDDTILIDFPPDTYMHMLYGGLDLPKIRTCIITHNHNDHFYPADIGMRGPIFAKTSDDTPLTFFATEPAVAQARSYFEKWRLDGRVAFRAITPFETFSVQGYEITPLKANHAKQCAPVFFIIKKGAKQILYAHDTDYFPQETWHYLESEKPYFNLISLDCTLFTSDLRDGHMGLPANIEVRDRLKQMGLIDQDSICVLNHFSHNGHITHDEMVPIAKKEGFIVAYDNLTIEF